MKKSKKYGFVKCAYDRMVSLEQIQPNPKNPNTHPDDQIRLLAKIINEQGWRAPITVSLRSKKIVRGHGRFLAAKLLGLEKVPVDFQDYESEDAEIADLIADNKISEFAELDAGLLSDLLKDIDASVFDLTLTAIPQEEIDDYVNCKTDLIRTVECVPPAQRKYILLSVPESEFQKIEMEIARIKKVRGIYVDESKDGS